MRLVPTPPSFPMSQSRFGNFFRGLSCFAQKIDHSRQVSLWGRFVLFLFTALTTYSLVDHYYFEQAFEADAWICVDYTRAFMRFIWHLDPSALPELNFWPPYFDGVFILHALGSLAMIPLRNCHVLNSSLLPTEDSVIIWTIRQMNWLGYAIASIPFFRAAKLLSRSNLFAFMLGTVFALCPMIIAMDIMRIDYPIITSYVFILWFSLRIVHADKSLMTGALLGLFMAFLANTKITGFVLLFIPALAVIIAIVRGRYRWSQLFVTMAVFLLFSSVFFTRYFFHSQEMFSDILSKITEQAKWGFVFTNKPIFFYNWNFYLPYGNGFLVFFIFCLFVAIFQLLKKPRRSLVFLLLVLAVLTLMGIPVMKYERGGYMMIPFYLLLMAASVQFFVNATSPYCGKISRIGITTFCLICLLPTCYNTGKNYAKQLSMIEGRPSSIQITRIDARRWFKNHVQPEARIAHVWGSDWASPPIFDLGFSFSVRGLDIPLLDPVKLPTYEPPVFEDLDRSCDIILVNDFYKWVQVKQLREHGLLDLANRWEGFFQSLPVRYPMKEFRASSPNYFVQVIQVFVVNKTVMKDIHFADLVENP